MPTPHSLEQVLMMVKCINNKFNNGPEVLPEFRSDVYKSIDTSIELIHTSSSRGEDNSMVPDLNSSSDSR